MGMCSKCRCLYSTLFFSNLCLVNFLPHNSYMLPCYLYFGGFVQMQNKPNEISLISVSNYLKVIFNQPVFSHQRYTVEDCRVKINSIPFIFHLERNCSLLGLEQIRAIFLYVTEKKNSECETLNPCTVVSGSFITYRPDKNNSSVVVLAT